MSAARNSAFQASRTLLSRPGRIAARPARRAGVRGRAAPPADGSSSRSTTCRMLPRVLRVRIDEVPAVGDAVVADHLVGVVAAHLVGSRRATRGRTCLRCPRSRRPRRRRSRPPDAARSRSTYSIVSSTMRRYRGFAGDEVRVQVRAREQRVVVEHLLEVRDEPVVVGGVAGEAAAELVVHAAGGHRVERRRDHLERLRRTRCARYARHRKSSVIAGGNFGARAEAAVVRLELRARRCRTRRASSLRRELDVARRVACTCSSIASVSLPRVLEHFVAAFAPRLGHGLADRARTTACRADPRSGSRCRRRTAGRRACTTRSWASRRGR